MRYLVFVCKKCGHELYVENTDNLMSDLCKLSVKDCPECGEEGLDLWILSRKESKFESEVNNNV